MKVKQKPLSFSLCAENIAYVEEEYSTRHRNRSHWMDDLLTHLRLKKTAPATQVETTKVKGAMNKAKRSTPKKAASYPDNLDEQFEMLWDTKGKKGAKNGARGAYELFKKLAANVDSETCETFTRMLIDDILKNSGECGYPEMHLTSYLNQQRWDK